MGDLFSNTKKDELLLNKIKKLKELIENIDHLKRTVEEVEEIVDFDEETPSESEKSNEYVLLDSPKKEANALEQELMEEIARNKKGLIMAKIIEYTDRERSSSKDIKRIIVDKHKYCSKATYYRYIDELKKEGKLQQIEINNRRYLSLG